MIFDHFISTNSIPKLNDNKSEDSHSHTKDDKELIVDNINLIHETHSEFKTNWCYIWYWVIKLWIERRWQVLTFQSPNIKAKIEQLKHRSANNLDTEYFKHVLDVYISRMKEINECQNTANPFQKK